MASVLYTDEYVVLRRELVKARRHLDMTQAQLAAKLRRTQTFVSKYEQGERRLDVVDFMLICKALDIDSPALLRRVLKLAKQEI